MTEADLYEQVARYMALKHPDVLTHWDLSGVWTPSHKARNLYARLNHRAWPDLFIAKPILTPESGATPCAGLFLELKREGTRLKKRDDSWASQHIAEQAAVLGMLRTNSYYAEFAIGYDEAIAYIEAYLQEANDEDLF